MAFKRKLKQISNYDENPNDSSLSSSMKELSWKQENEENRYWIRVKGYMWAKPKKSAFQLLSGGFK